METSEEQSIIEVTQAFAQAWNYCDAKALAAFYTADGVRVGAAGDVTRGYTEIEAAYESVFRSSAPGSRMTQERGTVRMLSSELALWQGAFEVSAGDGGETQRGYAAELLKKVDGRWLLLEAHPKFFPPPPVAVPSTVAAEVLAVEQSWSRASVQKDRVALERIIADDYLYAHANGSLLGKEAELDEMMAAESKWSAAILSDMRVRYFRDVAVVTGVDTLEGSGRGYTPGARRFTDIFVKRDGRWQCVAGQGTLTPVK